jgi:hypothetical protein
MAENDVRRNHCLILPDKCKSYGLKKKLNPECLPAIQKAIKDAKEE